MREFLGNGMSFSFLNGLLPLSFDKLRADGFYLLDLLATTLY